MSFATGIGAAGLGATALGGIFGAVGNLTQAQAQSNMYNYQAGVAQVNQVVAQQNANYAEATGEVEAQQSGMKTRAQVGASRAGFGAGNVAITTGSAGRVISSETAIGQTNEAVIRSNAAKRAYGFAVGAAEDTAQAGAYKVAAETSTTAGGIQAASTILGAAGSVSSKWLQGIQSGVFSG